LPVEIFGIQFVAITSVWPCSMLMLLIAIHPSNANMIATAAKNGRQ